MSGDDRPDRPDPEATEMVDLGDADVSAVEFESQRSLPTSGPPPLPPSLPPSLPPEVRASAAPPPPRSNRFYVVLLVAFLAVGIVGGIAVAMGTRGAKAPDPSPSASASVMTLPTIEMNDDEDAGK